MKKEYTFDFEKYAAASELSAPDRELAEAAKAACGSAHAPYSGFRVGAAARLKSGRILTGSNQESEVFPSTMCAERTLLYHWQSAYGHPEPAETSRSDAAAGGSSGSGQGEGGVLDPIEALAIASVPDERECYPCGGCRQVLLDSERRQGSPIRVLMCSATTISVVPSATSLLPFQFSL